MIHKEMPDGGECVSVRIIEDTFRNITVETGTGVETIEWVNQPV